MKHPKKKFGLLLAILMALQLLVPAVALADAPPAVLKHGDGYLVIHETNQGGAENPYVNNGGWSSISVMDGTTEISPDPHGVYNNVPEGATVSIRYALHLITENPVIPGEYYSYADIDDRYFIIIPPKGIQLQAPVDEATGATTFDIKAGGEGGSWRLGSGELQADGSLKITLDKDGIGDKRDLWAFFDIHGSFEAVGGGVPSETKLELGGQTFTFKREMPDLSDTTLVKKGKATYDAASNEITWRVTVTPPANVALGGVSLVDTFSPNQDYVSGSFTINSTPISTGDEANPAIFQYDATTRTITYNFPVDATGAYNFTYKTKPLSFGGETGATGAKSYDFQNDVKLMQGTTELKTDDDKITANWVSKSDAAYTNYNGTDGLFKWTVNVNVPGGSGTVTGATITDLLPAGLELLTGTGYPVQISLNGGAATSVEPGTGDNTYTYTAGTRELVYRFPSGGTMVNRATLSYYTKITSRDGSITNNDGVTFNNEATFNWNQNPAPLTPPKDIGNGIVPVGGLVKKSVSSAENYVYSDNTYIQWTIIVNENRVNLANAIISDEIQAGQELVIDDAGHPFVVTQYSGSPAAVVGTPVTLTSMADSGSFDYTEVGPLALEKFSYSLDTIANTDYYTITYYTRLTPEGVDRFYLNSETAVQFSNEAVLTTDSVNAKGPATKTFNSQLVDKTNAGYNYSDRSTKWTVVINRNQMPLNNAQVADTLPAGMTLLIDGEHPFTVTPALGAGQSHTAENGGTAFGVNLGTGEIRSQYTITFYTRTTDDALKTQTTGTNTIPFINNVTLTATELPVNGLSDSSTVRLRNPVVTKFHDPVDPKSGVIHWAAYLNLGMLTLTNASVTDELNSGIALVDGSVKLSRCTGVTFKTDGTVNTVANKAPVTLGEGDVTYEDNTLVVRLPSGADSPYVFLLEFDAAIVDDNLDFINSITLSGATSQSANGPDADRVRIASYWSGGGGGSYVYTLKKTTLPNGAGDPVPGAVYRLINAAGVPIKVNGNFVQLPTDANGEAIFTGLPERAFYAIEVDAPDGYLRNPEPIRLTPNGTAGTFDDLAVTNVEINKVSVYGVPLTGGQFGLYPVTEGGAASQPYATAAAQNGKVRFENIPAGDYIVKEMTAPSGYYLTQETISVFVTVTDDEYGMEVSYEAGNSKYDEPTLENIAIPGASNTLVRIKKVDALTAKSLAGAEFTLYDAAGKAVQTVVTNSDGLAWFAQVPNGSYTIRETKAPLGYYASETPLAIRADGSFFEFTVQNSTTPTVGGGSLVPTTGGESGALGFALLSGALALLVTAAALRKKRGAEK